MSIITIKNLSKKFQIGTTTNHSDLSWLKSTFSGKESKKTLWAVKDVSFSIESGEIIGIVGPNGAGKSTILNIIAGIYKLYDGKVDVSGRVLSASGLVNCLQDRLNMIDNIYICTALFGLSRKETSTIVEEIVLFAELDYFRETKLYQFSTGMIARLIFSIAVHSNPSVLLLDEVTSNLDKRFTKVVTDTVHRLAKEGVVIIVVSHKKEIIEQCDKAFYIKKGRLIKFGDSKGIVNEYFNER